MKLKHLRNDGLSLNLIYEREIEIYQLANIGRLFLEHSTCITYDYPEIYRIKVGQYEGLIVHRTHNIERSRLADYDFIDSPSGDHIGLTF